MTSVNSIENQKVSLELATGDITKLKSSVKKIGKIQIEEKIGTLDKWTRENDNSPLELSPDNDAFLHYQMPRRLNWNMFKKIYDIPPRNYEQLISTPGFGPAAVRALSLIGEIIFGTKASWQDPVKFNFAHGGKDGVPYPIACKVYDKSINYLSSAIEGAEIQREERIRALEKLANYSSHLFS